MKIRVLGMDPRTRPVELLRSIMLVTGQKQQLLWDLPPVETFELNRAIFDVPRVDYSRTMDELITLLELGDLIRKPTRQLSLGERMKCELAAALVHRPMVLFLDEPTIGLDVSMQSVVRGFIKSYSDRHGATVLLTSHYMADVQALCKRVVVIDGGRILYDGSLRALSSRYAQRQTITATVADPAAVTGLGEVVSVEGDKVTLLVEKARSAAVAGRLLAEHGVTDLTIEDPPVEDVIEQVFAAGTPEPVTP